MNLNQKIQQSVMTLSVALLLLLSGVSLAGDLGINVIVSGEVAPGVYGQVQIGNSPPPVVYSRPVIIVPDSRYASQRPIYLHVPPGHAKHWSKHCSEYNACGRPIYFVKSTEYQSFEDDGDDDYRQHHEYWEGGKKKDHGQGKKGNHHH